MSNLDFSLKKAEGPRSYLVHTTNPEQPTMWLNFYQIIAMMIKEIPLGISDIVDCSDDTQYQLLVKADTIKDLPINGEPEVLYLVKSEHNFYYYDFLKQDFILINNSLDVDEVLLGLC